MALFFFHLCDGGDTLIDREGREVADQATLPELALRDARSLMAQDVLNGRLDLKMFIQVRDQSGALVHELRFRDALKING